MIHNIIKVLQKFTSWYYKLNSETIFDTRLFVLILLFKAYRMMCIWLVTFILEKLYLHAYLDRVFLKELPPPQLDGFVAAALAMEFVTTCAFIAILFMIKSQYTSPFVIDGPLIFTLCKDYFISSLTILVIGSLLARSIHNDRLFRYKHDGMRGIRAHATMTLKLSFVVIAIPFFLI